jgi:MFS transporter, DHA1 family, inner membrane transport protein
MSAPAQHHALTKRRETITLLALTAVQFTHILDFMIMMPLGAQLMKAFAISPAQFTHLVASYGLAAAASGLAGGFVLDRFDRKRALLILYAGFAVATLACGFAPSFTALLAARIAAGAFGGLAGAMVTAMVGDIIPPERRGRAMSLVMSAFPLASVLGIPIGLFLAGRHGWHAAFHFLGGCSLLNLLLAAFALPHLRTAVARHHPLRQMKEILSHGVHLRAFAVSAVLVMAGGCIVPFLAPSFVANLGLTEAQLPTAYICGGLAAFVSTPLIGRLSDRFDRLHLLGILSVVAAIVAIILTNLGPSSLAVACLIMALFMVAMSGRFAPTMAMVANSVEARYRGGFMSVNSALQQAANGVSNLLAGLFVTVGPGGRLLGYPHLGLFSVGFFVLTYLLAYQLRAVAPHVSRPTPQRPPPPEVAAV